MADRSPLPAFLSPVRCLWFFLVGRTEQSHGTSEALQKGMGELPYITTLRENCQGGYSTKARGKQRADGHRLSLPPTPSPCPITMTSFATWEKWHVGRLDGGSWHLKGALLTAVFLTGDSEQSVGVPCGSLSFSGELTKERAISHLITIPRSFLFWEHKETLLLSHAKVHPRNKSYAGRGWLSGYI